MVIRSIEKVEVEKLFGYYDYKIERRPSFDDSDPLIIYGDNGSGKTTLLKIIFYLISTADSSGHKSNIAKIKFKQFSIFLNGNVEIIAKREKGKLIGSYHFIVKEKNKIKRKVFLEANSELSIRLSENPEIEEEFYGVLNFIKELNISIHYLSDKRKLIAGTNSFEEREMFNRKRTMSRYEYERSLIQGDIFEPRINNELDDSVEKLESWIKKHILQGSKLGDENTNSIYSDLIKRVSNQTNESITKEKVINLIGKLSEIRKESESFRKYGLISKIETKDIEKALDQQKESNLNIIYNILVPYVEGLSSRLNSLEETKNIIDLFVNNINDYFYNKNIVYHLADGFLIFDKELGENLDLSMLSSGEIQLLLLFCNVITASDDASIFIIDEPEISLNIKWQRKLINTLLLFSENKNIQFIFASHSIELLSGHKDSVCKLEHNTAK